MLSKLENLVEKYKGLNDQMANPEVTRDIAKLTSISKELKHLDPIIKKYEEYKKIQAEVNDAKELLEIEDDADMIEMLKMTVDENTALLPNLEDELKVMLLPRDPNDGKNAIMEIRGAAGGDEANIFAGDLFRMYSRYFDTVGLKVEILDEQFSDNGGYSLVSFMVKGDDVFSKLKFESGSHRVQRIPQTESSGRIHTSTATVIVMPEAETVDIDIKPNDIKVDVFRSGGAGGQSVNTTDSAVRITHLPTGTVVTCQNERSQIQNREHAMVQLRTKLYDLEMQKINEAEGNDRKNKLGSGDRSEKIRTYNYPQNRVTDHRIGLTLNKLDQVMEGKMDEIIEALIIQDQVERLNSITDEA